MVALKVEAFGGMVPAVGDRLLQDNAAALAENTWLASGELIGMTEPTYIRDCVGTSIGKVYRIPNNYNDGKHLGDSIWMEFVNADTDVVRSAIIGDTYDRYYWASPAGVPQYNTKARIENGDTEYTLGIPEPETAPGVSPSGGVGIATSRAYVYTWVSTFGEEGPVSPPTVATGKVDDTWALTFTAPLTADTTNRTLAYTNIYRTVTDSFGVTNYFYVGQVAIGTLSYNDTATDDTVSLNSILESTNWIGPPTDLEGWVALPNGMIAGFRENEIWFCEPYRPHAWPAAYALVVDYPIVGLGVVNQTLVVATQANPYTCTGSHPAIMALSKLTQFEPCMSRGSILSTVEGVYYASPNGLVLVNSGIAQNITTQLVSRQAWSNILAIPTLRAARFGTTYYAWGSTRFGVFEETAFETTAFAQYDNTGAVNGLTIDPQNPRVALVALSTSTTTPVTNVMNDPWSGEVIIIQDNKVYWIDLAAASPTYVAYQWKSKIFQTSDKKNLAAIRVYFEVPATTPTQNPVRNTNLVQTLQTDQYGLLRVYADGVLVTTRELRTSGEIMRVVSDRKADFWQVEIEGRVKIFNLQVATSMKALKNV